MATSRDDEIEAPVVKESRSDKTLLKLDATEFQSAMYSLKREDPERVEMLRTERRKMRQHSYEAANPDAVKEKKRKSWARMVERDPEFVRRHAERERERYKRKKP
jgi:hypothetical protein